MSKLLDGLFPKTQRIDAIMAYNRQADKSNPGTVYNLLEDPEYVHASFLIRRAMFIRKNFETWRLRTVPGQLMGGSTMGCIPHYIIDTLEERRKYGDYSMNIGMLRAVYGDTPTQVQNPQLLEDYLRHETNTRWCWCHSCLGLESILHKGYLGMAEEARAQMDAMQQSGQIDRNKMDFWQAVILCCEAISALSERYSQEYLRQAGEESDPRRREELLTISRNMAHVPGRPARTFHEALQATWFAYRCHMPFNPADLGRFDQLVYPYYKQDVEQGLITPAYGQELLDCLWAALAEEQIEHPTWFGWFPSIMLCGVNADGKDGTNELTYMCLNATRHVAAPVPKLSIRLNDQTPDDIWELSHQMLSSGLNMPDFYNERVILSAFERQGVPFEDAVCFAQSVCEEVSLAGISEDCTNEGIDLHTHRVVIDVMRRCAGLDVDFDGFLRQIEDEIRRQLRINVEFHNIQTVKLGNYAPQPLHSATIEGCIASGKDILQGGARYNNTGAKFRGVATAANSIYAIKRLVFDEKRLTLGEFLTILENNYDGQEALRAEILAKFPKYGNDQEEVDCYAAMMFDVYADELGRHTNSRGGCFKVGAWATGYVDQFMATPDGRKKGDSIAVNISPTPGTDRKGATAVIRSCTRIRQEACSGGSMVDVTLPPASICGPKGVQVLRQLVETYCALNGSAVQFNFVDSAMLTRAQEDPAAYSNLMVRVWGYNDYFVSLDKGMQRHILDRTRNEER